ncbi:hypothetical protein KX928_09095 [Roseobacter sp. YSTF-M11]|uniref:ABM domain-containing protein n=1 Tax=Roseobacter insulae TaxID=2859783 RepID=A0A9X1JY87_9RHOB|nr:hypothetical protein [Roseobacter insulae]
MGVSEPVAEVVTFRLATGVAPEEFLKAANGIAPFLRASGAVISRTLSVDADGLWTDHITWTSMSAAKTAAQELMQRPEAMPMLKAIEEGSATMRHAPIMLTMD